MCACVAILNECALINSRAFCEIKHKTNSFAVFTDQPTHTHAHAHTHTQHIREILQHNRQMQRVFHERKQDGIRKRMKKAQLVHLSKMETVSSSDRVRARILVTKLREICGDSWVSGCNVMTRNVCHSCWNCRWWVKEVRKEKLKAQEAYLETIRLYNTRARESHQEVTNMKINLKNKKLDKAVSEYGCHCDGLLNFARWRFVALMLHRHIITALYLLPPSTQSISDHQLSHPNRDLIPCPPAHSNVPYFAGATASRKRA